MKHIYEGKTKSVYELDDDLILLKFKDDVTCSGGVFDPGANSTGIKIDGSGLAGLRLSQYFFEYLHAYGIKTHFISADLKEKNMTVKKVIPFKKGLEVVCRVKSTGSFLKRYADYSYFGQNLDYFVEVTLKNDALGDPVISKDALAILGVMNLSVYDEIVMLTKKMTKLIENKLREKNLQLYDIKFEFGMIKDEIVLIDEISGGNMRVYQGDEVLLPLELTKIVLGE